MNALFAADEDEEPLDPDAPSGEPAAEPGEPADAAAQAATPPVEPAPAPVPPQTQEAQPTPEPAQPVPTPEAPPELTPEQVHARFKQWREQGVDLLAKEHFVIPADQVEKIVDKETGMVNAQELAAASSRLAARVYMDTVTAAMGQIVQNLPALINKVLEAKTQGDAAENKFFEAWPQLKPHRDTVFRVAQAYRKQNPAATVDQFVKEVGASAMIALRLAMPNQPAPPTPGQPAPAKPFRPAAATRPVTPAPTNGPVNPFARMAEEDMALDRFVEDV
jgi:hypothetical protein